MKALKIFMLLVITLMVIAFGTTVTYASELTTEPPTTEEPGTTTTTEEAVVTEPTEPQDPVIEFGEDGIYLDGILLTKDQIIEIMTYYIDLKFGDSLEKIGWTAAGLVTLIIGLGTFLLIRIKNQTLAVRANTAAKGEVTEYSKELAAATAAANQAQLRAAKAEAMTAVQMEMVYSLMANSSNKNIVQASIKYKDEIQKVLAVKDDISDTKQILETAGETILNQVVGTTLKEINDKKASLLASIQPYTDKEKQV